MYIGRWLESIPKLEELLKSTPYDPKAVLSLQDFARFASCDYCASCWPGSRRHQLQRLRPIRMAKRMSLLGRHRPTQWPRQSSG
jgi:hypothetical protein